MAVFYLLLEHKLLDRVTVYWLNTDDFLKVMNHNPSPCINLEWSSLHGDIGHSLLNKVLDFIPDDAWVYFLDDDNEMHPDFPSEIWHMHKENPESEGFIFSQYIGGRDFTGLEVRVAKPENVKVQKIDMAQFVLKMSLIGERKFLPMTYTADGIFIEEIYREYPEKFIFSDRVLCNYNSLQRFDKSYSLPRVLLLGSNNVNLKTIPRWPGESDDLNVKEATNDTTTKMIIENDTEPTIIYLDGTEDILGTYEVMSYFLFILYSKLG